MSEGNGTRYGGYPRGPIPTAGAREASEPILPPVDFGQLWGMVRRNAWLLVGGLLLGSGLAFYLVKPDPLSYTAGSAVRVNYDRRSFTGGIVADPALDANLGANPVQSQLQVLSSEAVLANVVDTLGFRLRPISHAAALEIRDARVTSDAYGDTIRLEFRDGSVRVLTAGGSTSGRYGDEIQVGEVTFRIARRPSVDTASIEVLSRGAALGDLRRGLSVRQRDRTDVIDITFSGPNATVAREVVNAVAVTAQSVSGRFAQQQAGRRSDFLEQQLRQTDLELANAHSALASFRGQSAFYSTRDGIGLQQSQLRDLERQREQLQAEVSRLRSFLPSLEASAAGGAVFQLPVLLTSPGLAENTQNRIIGEMYSRLLAYEGERAGLTSGPRGRSETDPDVERLDALIRVTHGNLVEAVRGQIASLESQLASVVESVNRESAALRALPEREAEESRLLQEVETLRQLSAQLRIELQRSRIAETVEAGQLEILDLAGSASSNSGRNRVMMALWVLLGVAVGGGIGVVREATNRSVRKPDDIEVLLQVPELAIIPPILPANGGAGRRLLPAGRRERGVALPAPSNGRPASRMDLHSAEAFRLLRTNLLFLVQQRGGAGLKTVLITSSDPGDGKTTTALNLSVAFARLGKRVLMIDADLHRPRLHLTLRMPAAPGIAEYLADTAPIDGIVQPTPIPNLSLIPAGAITGLHTLSDTDRMAAILQHYRMEYDLILLDTPPVRATADATFLSVLVDGVVLVVRAGRTDRESLRRVTRGLQAIGANVVGAVLNDPDAEVPRYSGSYYYPHAYYAESTSTPG